MKKTFAIIISAVIIITSITGCNSNNDAKTLVLWHSMADEAGLQLEAFVDEFNSGRGKELGITVEAIFQGAAADASTKLRTILQNGQYAELPDIMQIDATGIVDYQSSGLAFSVDDALALDTGYEISQLLEAPLKAWSFDGVQLGMPFNSSTTVMYYNKSILDAAGFSDPPDTFAGITAVSERLGQGIAAYAHIPDTPSLANWIGQLGGDVVNNGNGRDSMATRLVCDEEGTLELFLHEWKRMHDAGAVLNQSSSLTEMFLAEQIVFLTASTSRMMSLLAQIDGRFELGCAYFPRIHEGASFGATISGSAMFMFDKGSSDMKLAAWELLKYLASPEVQARFSVATGYFPVNKAAYDVEVYREYAQRYPQLGVATAQVEMTRPDMAGVMVGPSRDFYLEIQNRVSDMLLTGADPAAAAQTMAGALNSLLEQYAIANP
ncbi:MAG: extracellular solute-binding protein [Oscillospiraceae bacterium]|nr:extracellular solute-binding protein [Oscillospiraceae bacterium]